MTVTRPLYATRVACSAALLTLGIGIATEHDGAAASTPTEGPYSLSYLTFQPITPESVATYSVSPPSSQSPDYGLSFGVYNSDATITMVQNGTTIYQGDLTGEPFNFNFEQPGCTCSYDYVNLTSSSTVTVTVDDTGSGTSYFNYDLYSSSIDGAIAALILYPAQWGVNFAPGSTPSNSGMSFTVTAPTFDQPTSLAMWVGEGGPLGNGQSWWAQLGFTTITTNGGAGNVAYPFFEVFPGGSSNNPGGQDYDIPLVPGQAYTFTMKEVNGDTWEFLVNNVLIQTSWPSALNGTYTFSTSYANENADFAVESFVSQGGGLPNVDTPIDVPNAMQFDVDGQWVSATSLSLPDGGISENWHNSEIANAG